MQTLDEVKEHIGESSAVFKFCSRDVITGNENYYVWLGRKLLGFVTRLPAGDGEFSFEFKPAAGFSFSPK